MKQTRLSGLLTSCLLLVSGMAALAVSADEADQIVTAGSVKDIVNVTVHLAETPSEQQSGFVYAEDGSASYVVDGETLTGHFTVQTDYLKGDLEGNGEVDASDASLVLAASAQAAVGEATPGEVLLQQNSQLSTSYQAEQIADINNDGKIDASDAAALLEYISRVGSGEQLGALGCGQYYADENGVLQKGWFSTGDGTYYAYEDYTLAEDLVQINGKRYCFSENAQLLTGQVQHNGATYFFGSDGAMLTGWLDAGDSMYYFDMQSGAQAFGVTQINGELYYFDEGGSLLSGGWLTTADGIRYADESGVLLTSFQTMEDGTYYFDEEGVMASGLSGIGEDTYYFAEDGKQQFGWQEIAGGVHYFDEETGKMAVGFTELEDGTRYFDENGVMLTDWQTINDSKYYFDTDGIMQTGTVTIDDEVYRFRTDGVYAPVKICLDAGHYAKYNHSPVNDAYWESDFTWKIHLYLKEALEGYGIEVITTRDDKDTDLPLASRGYMSEGCDLFLSLHSNACGTESIDAPLACCTVTGTADELGQMLADKVAEVMETNQPGKIWKRQGKDGDWYSVLWGATKVGTPAILLEHSYHTNKRATAWLLVDENVKRMAEEEAKLLAEYYGLIEAE